MRLGIALNRLFFFVLMTGLSTHLCSCLWLFQATFETEYDGNEPVRPTWMNMNDGYREMTNGGQYLCSVYWTIIISYGNAFSYN